MKNSEISKELSFSLSKTTTRSHKRKAIGARDYRSVVGTSKSPKVQTEYLEKIKSTLWKEIQSDLTKILAENRKEMLKLKAPVAKKQAILTVPKDSDSESENVPPAITSTPVKFNTTTTTLKPTPVNSRNRFFTLH